MRPETTGKCEIEVCLRAAIHDAYEGEHILFAEQAHERSIVFHIARRLASYVDELLPGWSVDVDYDRWHPGAIDGIKKQLHLAGEPEEGDVYPDIVVHRRSGSTGQDNLLVAEVKKKSSPYRVGRDRKKLQAFMAEPFSYQHAVLIEIPEDGGIPYWQWLSGGQRLKTRVFRRSAI